MNIQVLDVDYIMVGERPIIRIFGKDEGGKSVCVFYEGYQPYLYAEGEGVEKVLENDNNVVKMERVQRGRVMGFQEPKDIFRITTKNPAKTPEIREMLKSRGIKPYEADILFKYRFMNDFGIDGLGWINVSGVSNTPTNTVNSLVKIKAESIRPVKIDGDVPLTFMSFDIECVPSGAGMPDAKKDPIILISMVFSKEYKGRKSMVLSTRSGNGVTALETEKEMLGRFIDIINGYDPDIITGFNINNFDLPYILERMKRNGIRPVFGRCKQKGVMSKKIISRYSTSIVGRIILDSFEIIKKDFSLMRYNLNFVADTLLKEKKDGIKVSDILKLWTGNQEGFSKLVKYCEKDSRLAMDLVLKINLMDKYVALSKVSGTLLQDTLNSGETIRIENFLLREFNRAGYVFPCKPDQSEVSKREEKRKVELKGGFVIEPDKKLHSDVVVMDFKSMYPSIIRTFNICPTTLYGGSDSEGVIKTPLGIRFVSREKRGGIIPQILEKLMKRRQSVQKRLGKCEERHKRSVLYAEQWALKIMANAFYGYMGYSRARIYDLDIANAITACGREIIKNTRDIIEREFGYSVVYGDTDSVMVKVDTSDLEKIRGIATDISENITKKLPGIIELEFEKVFRRFLPLTKKRYVAWRFEPSNGGWKEGIEMKGIETVRRDWCDLVSETMGGIIEKVLKEDDIKGAVEHFKGVVKSLVGGDIDIQKLVVTKTMTKLPKHYEGMQPHVELVKKIHSRNPRETPGIGDRIGYVIVKGMGLLSKRAEDPSFVIEKGLQVDSKYYIENQLLPPLERIFGALGISKSELLGNGKQISLMESLSNYKGPESLKEIPSSIMNGFVCNNCSRFYSRTPLIGRCECGGNLLFSSPKGSAEFITH